MAERSKALDSSSSEGNLAWVQIPLRAMTLFFFHLIVCTNGINHTTMTQSLHTTIISAELGFLEGKVFWFTLSCWIGTSLTSAIHSINQPNTKTTERVQVIKIFSALNFNGLLLLLVCVCCLMILPSILLILQLRNSSPVMV